MNKIFEKEDVLLVLNEMREENKGVLDEKFLVFVCNLVEFLVNVFKKVIFFEELKDICILDENGVLFFIWILCWDDSILLWKGKLLKFIYFRIRGKDVEIFGGIVKNKWVVGIKLYYEVKIVWIKGRIIW